MSLFLDCLLVPVVAQVSIEDCKTPSQVTCSTVQAVMQVGMNHHRPDSQGMTRQAQHCHLIHLQICHGMVHHADVYPAGILQSVTPRAPPERSLDATQLLRCGSGVLDGHLELLRSASGGKHCVFNTCMRQS